MINKYRIVKFYDGEESEDIFTDLSLEEAERIIGGLKVSYRDNEKVKLEIIKE